MSIVQKDWVNEATVKCNCGCGEIEFTYWKEDAFAYMAYNLPAFYAYQRPLWSRIKEGAGIIWAVLTGKQYRLFEATLFEEDNEQIRAFKKFAEGIKEIEKDEKH